MSDWAKRLQNLQSSLPQPETESVDHWTLEALKDEKMKFGKAHAGKSFQEVWETAQPWIKWFLSQYQQSGVVEHKKMIRFIKLKIEEAEGNPSSSQQMPMQPKMKAAPKSLGAASKSRPAPHPEMSHVDLTAEDPWTDYEMGNVEMTGLQLRMTNLENAVHQILEHLTPQVTRAPQNTSVEATLPVIPLASEWEDPWNA